jgi:hypothetical protein
VTRILPLATYLDLIDLRVPFERASRPRALTMKGGALEVLDRVRQC